MVCELLKKLDSYAFTLMCIKIWLHQPMILLLRSRLSIKEKLQLIKRNILSKKEKIFRGYKDTVKTRKTGLKKFRKHERITKMKFIWSPEIL